MKDNININLIKKDDKLEFSKVQRKQYNKFIDNIPDGAKVEMFISVSSDKGSNAQLARTHAMIRELASTLGYTFEEVKLLAKRKAGLCIVKNGTEYCKSFADCDREELNLVIQAINAIGDYTNTNLR